jgi:hypothetical protein
MSSRGRRFYIGLLTSGWLAALVIAGQAVTTPWRWNF